MPFTMSLPLFKEIFRILSKYTQDSILNSLAALFQKMSSTALSLSRSDQHAHFSDRRCSSPTLRALGQIGGNWEDCLKGLFFFCKRCLVFSFLRLFFEPPCNFLICSSAKSRTSGSGVLTL
jgi:hypothetical protein